MDANQLLEEHRETYNLGNLIKDCDLESVMNIKHPGISVNSTKTGSEMIDHILVANGTDATITKCGQLPFNLGFDTNHCAVYTDMRVTEMLQLHMEDPVQRGSHHLISKNVKNRTKYLRSVHTQLKAHNVIDRVSKLLRVNSDLSEEERIEYNKLDDTITAALLHAESTLPKEQDRV